MSSILFVDDDSELTLSLVRALKAIDSTFVCLAASTHSKALELASTNKVELAVVDLNLEPKIGIESGFNLLRDLLSIKPGISVIVLTGNGALENGVRALKMGADHFIEKPPNLEHLYVLIKDCLRRKEILNTYKNLCRDSSQQLLSQSLIGNSPSLEKLRQEIVLAASSNQAVLLLGETGTGKTLCASLIHQLSSRVKSKFVSYTSAHLNSDLANSELFGHLRGAFTGAGESRQGLIKQADQGTFFIDEVDELPQDVQVSLLKVLQSKSFRLLGSNREESSDFRLLSASNRQESEIISNLRLRQDFFHRIAHQIIYVPSLRQRQEDILPLASSILEKISTNEGLQVYEFSKGVQSRLRSYSWPGNIRELEAVVVGAAYRAKFDGKNQIDTPEIILRDSGQQPLASSNNFHDLVEKYKFKLVSGALESTANNQAQAAKLLGLDRSCLRRILART